MLPPANSQQNFAETRFSRGSRRCKTIDKAMISYHYGVSHYTVYITAKIDR